MDDVSAKLDRLSDQIQKISEASDKADATLQKKYQHCTGKIRQKG